MKKILTHLTGIVLLITILIAGSCTPAEVLPPAKDMSVVIIYVKATKVNGENHLELYDSNDTTIIVVDDLYTDVKDSTEVFWVLAKNSGLKKIKKVKPKNPDGNIMPGRAKGIWSQTNYKKHIVPDNAIPGEERYYIRVKDMNNNRWEIDPYLKIR